MGRHPRRQCRAEYLEAGASHVIVTSYVFRDGAVDWDRLHRIRNEAGRERLVLDLSCRRRAGILYRDGPLAEVHGCGAVCGRAGRTGRILRGVSGPRGGCGRKGAGDRGTAGAPSGRLGGIPVTYAGGVGSFEDLAKLKELGRGRLHVTIGSALDLFGGEMNYEEVVKFVAGSPK